MDSIFYASFCIQENDQSNHMLFYMPRYIQREEKCFCMTIQRESTPMIVFGNGVITILRKKSMNNFKELVFRFSNLHNVNEITASRHIWHFTGKGKTIMYFVTYNHLSYNTWEGFVLRLPEITVCKREDILLSGFLFVVKANMNVFLGFSSILKLTANVIESDELTCKMKYLHAFLK